MNLVTRLDFDGILCGVMIHDMENVADINFTDPKTMEEGGLLDILEPSDIIAHLPIHSDAGMWFHNHDASHVDSRLLEGVKGKWGVAPSTSRQVYEFYNNPALQKYEPIIAVADRIGTANLTQEDVQSPKEWVMISYTLDPRFTLDDSYGKLILQAIKDGRTPNDILALPAVEKRVDLYVQDVKRYIEEVKAHTKLEGNVILTDFRELVQAPRGNRFAVFVMYPDGNVHVRLDGLGGFRTKVSVSKSIFNRTCPHHIGRMMEEYGGGGPEGAGTCMLGRKSAPEKIPEILNRLKG
ncbi:hypothetical protein HQ587_10350 [bacterium]|nr:hypothetical protein [bacterium]